MNILAERIEVILKDCLYKDGEISGDTPPSDAVIVSGIISTYALHPGRLSSQKDAIAAICNELPSEFQKSKGGGWSFLNLCQTKEGIQWGEHRNCEQLIVLAIASGQGGYVLPKEMWAVLPGSMPYVWFDTQS